MPPKLLWIAVLLMGMAAASTACETSATLKSKREREAAQATAIASAGNYQAALQTQENNEAKINEAVEGKRNRLAERKYNYAVSVFQAGTIGPVVIVFTVLFACILYWIWRFTMQQKIQTVEEKTEALAQKLAYEQDRRRHHQAQMGQAPDQSQDFGSQ